jgi:hypothetical protein
VSKLRQPGRLDEMLAPFQMHWRAARDQIGNWPRPLRPPSRFAPSKWVM